MSDSFSSASDKNLSVVYVLFNQKQPKFLHDGVIDIATVRIRLIPLYSVKRQISQFWSYQRFAKTVTASSFGELLQKPKLLKAYKNMSDQKTVPNGLHENEVERGNFKKPLIPYIPVKDEIGEKVKSKA